MALIRLAATAFATIFIGFGINAIVRAEHALSFFELTIPTSASDRTILEAMSAVYGVRDIFMGLAIYAAAYLGNRKTLGTILVSAAAVAGADGAICKWMVGKGEMNHWGYAPMVAVVGLCCFAL